MSWEIPGNLLDIIWVCDYIYLFFSFHYRPAFYLFAGLFGVAAIGMLTVHLDFKLPAKRLLKDVGSLLKNVELDMLLVVAFVSGNTKISTLNGIKN